MARSWIGCTSTILFSKRKLRSVVIPIMYVFVCVMRCRRRQGIKDPLREDVKYAVEQCQVAGIMVRMVTGDNISTAKVSAAHFSVIVNRSTVLNSECF